MKRLLTGTITQKVTRMSPCAVLAVTPPLASQAWRGKLIPKVVPAHLSSGGLISKSEEERLSGTLQRPSALRSALPAASWQKAGAQFRGRRSIRERTLSAFVVPVRSPATTWRVV